MKRQALMAGHEELSWSHAFKVFFFVETRINAFKFYPLIGVTLFEHRLALQH